MQRMDAPILSGPLHLVSLRFLVLPKVAVFKAKLAPKMENLHNEQELERVI